MTPGSRNAPNNTDNTNNNTNGMARRNIELTTPRGTFRWPYLNEPDRQHDARGVYQVDLVLEPSEALDTFRSRLEEFRDAEEQRERAIRGDGKKFKVNGFFPVRAEVDGETEEETGNFIIRAKQKAVIDGRAGREVHVRPKLVDAKRQPMADPIGAGTTGRLVVAAFPYYHPKEGFGVSLRLKVAQVIDLVEPQENLGDLEEEDGYVSDGEETVGPDHGDDERGLPDGDDVDEI